MKRGMRFMESGALSKRTPRGYYRTEEAAVVMELKHGPGRNSIGSPLTWRAEAILRSCSIHIPFTECKEKPWPCAAGTSGRTSPNRRRVSASAEQHTA